MAVCALLAVFDVSVPFIKLDHNFNVSAETSCRMPDAESTIMGVKLSIDRVDGPFHGCCRGEILAAVT